MQEILILGTGKMARNIGHFFLRNDCKITWVSRDVSRAELFADKVRKDIRRLTLILDKTANDFSTHVCEVSKIPQLKYDLILESINEDLTQKQEAIQHILTLLKSDTILASNSSSILPNQIYDSAIGLHFFYPVELTGLAEVILHKNDDSGKIKKLISELKSWGIHSILQNEQNAFTVNRLLLPLQAEAFRLLQDGYPSELINECSKSDLISIGQLELMDSIGLDVLLPAIKNYVSRMQDKDQNKFDTLIDGLDVLIKNGKLGKKNKNGIMIGDPLSWQADSRLSVRKDQIKMSLLRIFKDTCRQFVEGEQIQSNDLDRGLKLLFN